jgi:exodeoxyribonuclease III
MNEQDTMSSFTLFCWNIGNPSLERAGKQAAWLRKQPYDVLLLTECKQSEGCRFLERYFQAYGYQVVFPKPDGGEYGVLFASKHPMATTRFTSHVTYLQSRVVSVKLPVSAEEVEIIGSYVPSRDASDEKKQKKKNFLSNLLTAFEKAPVSPNRIFAGDFNILEPDHLPHYSFFEAWEYDFYRRLADYQLRDAFRHLHPNDEEYSWVGRTGDGYRYDHCFVSSPLLPLVRACSYLHEPRFEKLSDHSAQVTEIIG